MVFFCLLPARKWEKVSKCHLRSKTTTERVKINETWYKGCGICVKYCPKKDND
jgi:Pyruvate/2-oxoacid:ferredoxin oxidoreductase delta subunit